MKKSLTTVSWKAVFVLVAAALFVISARAQDDDEKLYKTKCTICHAANGSGNTQYGKTHSMQDLRSTEVQNQTDAQLVEIIAKGRKTMPGYASSLKDAQLKELVTYIRAMAKEKKG